MRTDDLLLLSKPGEIADHVASLWHPGGPVHRNHRDRGMVHEIVERFARVPRVFFHASEPRLEWTHFSPWWGAVQIAGYDNPHIRDLRYLHEIHHAATMPYYRGMCLATMSARNAQNEREASTFSEMAVYLEMPDLRPLTFGHPILMDRIMSADADGRPDERLVQRWRNDRDAVFQELLYARLQIVLAPHDAVDAQDPQTVWLRRYPEQGDIWNGVWAERHSLVDDAMVTLRENVETIGPVEAGRRHLDWMLSPTIAEHDIPFRREALAFRDAFDRLIAHYDEAMTNDGRRPVVHVDPR